MASKTMKYDVSLSRDLSPPELSIQRIESLLNLNLRVIRQKRLLVVNMTILLKRLKKRMKEQKALSCKMYN